MIAARSLIGVRLQESKAACERAMAAVTSASVAVSNSDSVTPVAGLTTW
jgi:hypothetical protein